MGRSKDGRQRGAGKVKPLAARRFGTVLQRPQRCTDKEVCARHIVGRRGWLRFGWSALKMMTDKTRKAVILGSSSNDCEV